jgi:hypothetical protein
MYQVWIVHVYSGILVMHGRPCFKILTLNFGRPYLTHFLPKCRFVNGYRGIRKGEPTGVECEAIVNTSSLSG